MPWQFAAAQTSPLSPCSSTDIDKDNDGLIDICDLEGLNVIRYQLDGTGYKANELAEKITAGCPGNRCRGYELMRDLDFLDANSYRSGVIRRDWVVGSGWLPIGSVVAPFGSGNVIQDSMFEGNGYAIRNLMINRPNSDNVGLFAVNGLGGGIKDIRLLDVNIQGKSRVGALVARNEPGKIRNSYVSGSIRGVSRIGALVGYNSFTSLASPVLENSSATGVVIGTGDKVGGLVGSTYSTIKNSQAFNTVSGVAEVGGLVGTTAETSLRTGQIINSRAVGNVTGVNSVGGLIGRAGTAFGSNPDSPWRIINSHATGTVEGQIWVGGLVGNADIIHIENSSAHGEVIATGSAQWAGGLVGLINKEGGRIDKSHATGSVTGIRRVGGFLGGATGVRFDDSYATGRVQGGQGSRDVGGFTGISSGGSITNSYATGMVQVRGKSEDIGGFIGENVGTHIMNSYAIGNVRGGQGSSGVGGLIGSTERVNIINGYATGRVQGGQGSRDVGGFIGISSGGIIRNSHATGDVEGGGRVGGFVGQSEGTRIMNSYAASHVRGDGTVGGFIGDSSAVITNSYATGHVEGGGRVGGFVGFHDNGSITNSYAIGNVASGRDAGGFVGFHNNGSITNSYAIGNVKAERASGFNAGGSGFITNSYWDRQTSGRTSSVGGRGKTTSELQLPTTSTGIYSSWDDDVWDFGTSEQYPALKYSDGTLQPNQRFGLLRVGLPSGLILSPSFKSEVLSYRVIGETGIRQIRLTPIAANFDADIIIESSGGFRERMPSGTTSSEISLNTAGVTTATVEVRTPYDVPIRYTLAFNDRTFNEGERIILERITARDVDDSVLRYKWTQTSGMLRLLPVEGISQAVLDVPIPELFLSETEDDREITIRLEINDGTKTETKDLRLTIAKADNGTAVQSDPIITRSDRTLTAPEVDLSTDPDGSGTINSYLWQRRANINADWIDIEGVTGNMYRVPEDTAYAEYRVQYAYTDGQGYIQALISEVFIFISDVDIDNNGLIEINDLEGLDAIRYQPDGTGYRANKTADKITTGCPDAGCEGYELTRSLDFEQGTSYRNGIIGTAWTTGSGWLPIGTSEAPFDATFNASSHTISNLRIDRSNAARGVGLFGITASNAEIANVGLLDVDISGNQGVGGLVGYKQGGSIIGSYVTGQVKGSGTYDVGGLVGWHRGGTISDSYSSSTVVGFRRNVGGLVGDNDGGTISDSYAKGSVNGEEEVVGGLVGRNSNTGIIMRSRAEVKVDGGGRVGGLVGENSGIITNSYTRERIIGMADVGGMVGWNLGDITNSYALGFVKGDNGVGGFVGNNLQGTITNSYARGNVDGANRYVGGFVGWSARGAIINSYAQGNVRGKDGVGGLVGVNLGLANNSGVGRVTKSYATGRVRGDTNTGGLIGENRDGHVEKSYWNKTNNPTVVSAGGISRTSVEMQTPTQPGNNATEIYYDWSPADWDFSATDQYPTLKNAVGPDQSQPACGTAEDPDCGTPLTEQLQIVRTSPIEPISDIRLLTGFVKELNVVLSVGIGDGPTQFKTSVKSSNRNIATASIAEGGGLIRTLRVLTGSDIGRSEIMVSVNDGEGLADSVSSTEFVVTTETNDAPKITITSLSELVPVDDRIVISVEVMDDNFDAGDRVLLTSSVVPEVLVEPRQIVGISSNKTERITLKGVRGGTAMVGFTVIDSKGASDSETVSVRVDAKPTGSVRISFTNKWLLGSTSTIEDAGGIAEVNYRWYRNGVAIANATSRTYMIADNKAGRATGTSYRLELTVIDSIGQSVVIQSNSLRVANERPVIASTTATEMIDEGDTQDISVSASDPNYDDLMYRWSEDSGVLINDNRNPATLGIPPDYIKDAASSQTTVNLEVRVSDGDLATTGTVSVVVNKQNNGSATLGNLIEIGSRETTLTATVLSDDPDNGVSGAVGYQWQVCEGNEGSCPSESNWMNINDAGGTQYIISDSGILLEGGSTFPLVRNGSLFRAAGTYTDGQGYREVVYSQGYSYSGRVNASPTISGLPAQRIRLFEGTETEFEVELNDPDADDISGDLVFGVQSDTTEVARVDVEGAGTTRTIKITAIGVGMATITATVNDGRGVSNSEVSERFEVEVEGNEAPMLEIFAAPNRTIGLGNTTQVMVLVSDADFDVGDRVVLEAVSSSRSIVSVRPTRTDPIATDMSVPFTLSGIKAGVATIVFTATDRSVSTDSVSLLISVDAKPTGGVRIEPDSSNQWLLRVASTVEDANGIVEVNYQWYREGVAIASATNQTYMIPDNRDGRAAGTSYSLEMTVMDSLGQSVVIQSNFYRVANEQPVITVPVAEISEGDRQDISVTAGDPNYDDLVYRWIGDSGVLSNENSNPARLSIPPYYIRDAVSTQTTLNLEVEVNDGELFTTSTVSVVVNKKNNGSARLGASLDEINGDTAIMATVFLNDPDGGTGGAVAYQWQVCEGNEFFCPSVNNWLDIDGANEAQYIISGSSILVEGGNRFQIVKDISVFRPEVTYTDGQGYRETIDAPGYTHSQRVNNSPTISGLPAQRIRLLEGTETKFEVKLNDPDADDISSNLVFGVQSDTTEVARVDAVGEGTTRTIKITAMSAGITTVTAMVNDRRGVSNSEVSERFEVEVEENEAPMFEVIAAPQPAIRLGNTTQVVVLVSDTNFDVGDRVVLAARSSSRSIVSVIPMQTDAITTNASITFTLTGVTVGTATVVFTAMDSRGSTGNISLLVRVGAHPTSSVRIEPDSSNKWLLRATSTIEDADDIVGVNYRWYRNGVAITDATSRTYMIANNRAGRATGTSYRLDLIIMDNLGQSVVTQSNSYIVANERPVITSTTATEVIGEGDTQNISVSASDANYDDLMYRWSEDSGVFSNDNSNPATLDIPPDYIKDAASTRTTLNLEVEVSDGELATTSAVLVEVRKKNNGSATIRISVEIVSGGTTLTAMILSDDPDGGTSGTVVYQWQVCEGNEGRCPSESHWMNIDDAGGIRYMISGSSILVEGGNRFSVVEDGSLFRVKGTYTDGQGYREAVYSPERVYTTRPLLRIRTKVFLEGPLQ